MACSLIDFALVVLKLFMLKVCRTIGFSKVDSSNSSGTERVKQNKKKSKNHAKPAKLESRAYDNTNLHLNSNISKIVRANMVFS